jgi:hypothetical protein
VADYLLRIKYIKICFPISPLSLFHLSLKINHPRNIHLTTNTVNNGKKTHWARGSTSVPVHVTTGINWQPWLVFSQPQQ